MHQGNHCILKSPVIWLQLSQLTSEEAESGERRLTELTDCGQEESKMLKANCHKTMNIEGINTSQAGSGLVANSEVMASFLF